MRHTLRAVIALHASLLLVACDGEGECEPVYGGDATDEAWLSLQDGEARVQVGAAQAPLLLEPSAQAMLAAPYTFRWSSALAMHGPPSPGERRHATRSRKAPSVLRTLHDWLIPPAYAHLPPVTGDLHALRFSIPGRACPFRVLTTNLSWDADEAALTAFAAAEGRDISLELTSAYLVENRITEGPFRPSSPTVFTMP